MRHCANLWFHELHTGIGCTFILRDDIHGLLTLIADGGGFRCPICQRVYVNESTFNSHMQKHQEEAGT